MVSNRSNEYVYSPLRQNTPENKYKKQIQKITQYASKQEEI